jgi:DNA repair protein RecO (recombination protein O)
VIRLQDEAFVLDARELGESDLIVTLFTVEHGEVRAVARGARRSRRRFGGLLQPLTRVRARWAERDGRELQRLEALDEVHSFAAMQAEPARQAACAILAELTAAFSHAGQSDKDEFRLLGACLDAMEQGVDPAAVVRYFEYWTLRVHGLLPDLRACAACGKELAAGRRVSSEGLLCGECPAVGREARLNGAELEFLELLRRTPPAKLSGEAPRTAGLELLLRGSLESFCERRFRTYRHFKSASLPIDEGGAR